jgi:hypothetical protein
MCRVIGFIFLIFSSSCFLISLVSVRKEDINDTKGATSSGKSSKNLQHNGQKKKDKHWSTKHCTKPRDRVTRTPEKRRTDVLRKGGQFPSIVGACYQAVTVNASMIIVIWERVAATKEANESRLLIGKVNGST